MKNLKYDSDGLIDIHDTTLTIKLFTGESVEIHEIDGELFTVQYEDGTIIDCTEDPAECLSDEDWNVYTDALSRLQNKLRQHNADIADRESTDHANDNHHNRQEAAARGGW